MDVTVIGAGGLLGQDLVMLCEQRGFRVTAPTREQLDIRSDENVQDYFAHMRTDWIINCAAYVAVDDAETDFDAAYALNADGAGYVAKALAGTPAKLIHISTDFVFDGEKREPYLETDQVNPIGVYGASKLEGERRILHRNPDAIIARTAWLYGARKTNFPLKILEAALSKKSLRLVSDRFGSPTYTKDLAAALLDIIQTNIPGGIYHVVNKGEASWWEFCTFLMEIAEIPITIEKASNSDYPTPAARPMYSVLSTSKLKAADVPQLPTWQSAAKRFIGELDTLGKL